MLHSVRNARAAVTPGTVAGSAWRTRGQPTMQPAALAPTYSGTLAGSPPTKIPQRSAAQAAFTEGRSFGDLLAADTRVTERLDPKKGDRGAAGSDRLYGAVRGHGARGRRDLS